MPGAVAHWDVQPAYKPGSVGRLDDPSGRSFLSEYSRPYPLAAYPRRLGREGRSLAAYLALLRLGFTVPFMLPRTRWALTPPFHPYPRRDIPVGGLFSVALAVTRHIPEASLNNDGVCPGVTWQSVPGARTFLASVSRSTPPRPSGRLHVPPVR
jgi:hypothetical protein